MGSDQTITVERGVPTGAPEDRSAPQLIVVMASEAPVVPSRHLLAATDLVTIGRGQTEAQRGKEGALRRLSLRLPDPSLSSLHARLVQLGGRWVIEDAGSKNGSLLNGAPVRRGMLEDGDLLELGQTFLLFRADATTVAGDVDLVQGQLAPAAPGLETFSGELGRAFQGLERIAGSVLPVLLRGASGTGKEVIARALHTLSRRAGAFVAVNCAAIPETLVESELFGHKKGAFTGATEDRPGHLRRAQGGTLFLDEIGDLEPPSQGALLRALQEKEVVPVGGGAPIPVDFRCVAATHQPLEKLVEEGRFRRDLLARLSGYVVELPPLADRREDLGILVPALLARVTARGKAAQLAPAAIRALLRYDWPLNVRELEMALHAAHALAGGGRIELEHLPKAVQAAAADAAEPRDETPLSPQESETRDRLVALLEEHQGNVAAVARVLGKGREQIHRWARRFRIELGSYRK